MRRWLLSILLLLLYGGGCRSHRNENNKNNSNNNHNNINNNNNNNNNNNGNSLIGSFDASAGAQLMQSRAADARVQLEVLEGQPKGTLVGSIPTQPGFTYRFNEPPKEFVLNGSSGEIRTTVILDREALKQDRFDLVVLSSQPTYPIEVRILVLDVNDNAPEFPEPSIAVAFSENAAAGTKLLLDTAVDRDVGVNGVSNDYSIVAGNEEEKFRLEVASEENNSYYLYLKTTAKLDREVTAFYQLNVSARDGGVPIHYGYQTVNVTILDANDNPPVFSQSDYSVALNESSPIGTLVLTVAAADADQDDNARISYYLSDLERRFTVDSDSGAIYTAEEPLRCPSHDCPQIKQFGKSCPKSCVFTVYARDHGIPQQDGRAYVTVNLLDANDHDPVIKFNYFPYTASFATVDENAVNGSVVAAVSVLDPDEGANGETTVEIRSGNELNHFRMDASPQSFDIIRVNGVLDREQIGKYNLTIVARDKGTPSRSSTAFLIIRVNDVNDHEPVFEKSEYSAVLNELVPVGTYVAGITATDEDSGVNAFVRYSIVSGNNNRWFEIDPDTGLVTTAGHLDREQQGTIELTISARDGGPNPKWAYTHLKVIILDENDEAPTFRQPFVTVNLPENVPVDTTVATLSAVDHDQGTNGSVTYALRSDADRSMFAVDSLTGQLTNRAQFDRETVAEYRVEVIAKDQGVPSQSATATVLVTLSDVNDNDPIFYPRKYFAWSTSNGAGDLLTVTAFDPDFGTNGTVRYRLEEEDEEAENGVSDEFAVNEKTGLLKQLTPQLSKNFYLLTISAVDQGGRKCPENAVVQITNERMGGGRSNSMRFEADGSYLFRLKEDDALEENFRSRIVGHVRILDASTPIAYHLVDGDANGNFEIDQSAGIIKTRRRLDREERAVYSLTVVAVAAQDYRQFARCAVNVTVTDVNDNRPTFGSARSEIRLPEDTAVGQQIFLARAKDTDSGENGRVTYELESNDEYFVIGEDTGAIYLNRPIFNRVVPGSVLTVDVKASDSGNPSLSAKHTINVFVSDVNDHTPRFADTTSYETVLSEWTPVNERFYSVRAVDDDFAENALVTYDITDGNVDDAFGIFPDGYVYVRKPLDREQRDYYCLTVRATDAGRPWSRSSRIPLIIRVQDENDNKPEFANSTFNFWLKENEPIDTFVGKLVAADKDVGRNAELIYSVAQSPNTKSEFVLDSRNGFVRTARVFDRETIVQSGQQSVVSFEATVRDNGSPSLRDKVKVNVYITDVNDNAPQFLRLPYRATVSENAATGTQILRVFTSDADDGLNKDVFYSLANDDKRFCIEETTGQIFTCGTLDREKQSRYELTVIAHDAGLSNSLSNSTVVTVEVSDENDNAPVFASSGPGFGKISISEDTPINSKLYRFVATDADVGPNGEITYSISAGNRRDAFQIDPVSGTFYLRKKLDFEDIPSYALNITASDNGSPRLSSTLPFVILVEDVNDNAPVFPSTAIVRQIRENIPIDTPIVTVTADDPDSGLNGNIVYSIGRQEPFGMAAANGFHFRINPKTGVIHTRLPIDRESVDAFRLTVVATDQAIPETARLSAEKVVTVIVEDVNDNAPVFVSGTAALIRPGSSFVTNVLARDADSGTNGLVTYDFIAGNYADLFQLHRTSGAITLKKTLNEPQIKYQLSIRATDEAVQSERKSTDFYLTIITPSSTAGRNDLRFDHDEAVLFGTVYENEPIGTNVISLNARAKNSKDSKDSKDSRYEIEYYVTNITASSGLKEDRLFDIDPKIGIVSTVVVLDRENSSEWYEIEVYAIVINTHSPITASTKVRIEILDRNDSPPSFIDMLTNFTVSEDLPIGHVVTTVKATDPDAPTRITYSLVGGDTDKFTLDQDTGVLSLADLLDRETKSVHKLQVQANDGLQKTTTTLTITVLDTNDNAPIFLETIYSFEVPENSPRGTRAGQIAAEDPDEAINGIVTYSVISDWANDIFSLNPQTGVFTLTGKLDYEEIQHYLFTAQAQDSGRPVLSSTVTVYFNVIDLNDNQPIFDQSSYTAEIYENATITTPVITVSASDLDSGSNGEIEYSLITEQESDDDFRIWKNNGTIYTNKLLDRETKAYYNLMVVAKDRAKPPQIRLSATVQVSITLKDVNDMAPEFICSNETSVRENTAPNTVVTAIKAIDRDEGRNGYLEYSLVDQSSVPDCPFVLSSADGLLRLVGKLDRETKANYTLKVRARDRGEPAKQTEMILLVKVEDDNDNRPVFNPKQYSAFVAENVSIGVAVIQVFATDEDEGANGRIRYSIVSGDENLDFNIGEDNGILRVANNLNFERKSKYTLSIKAEDEAGSDELDSRSASSVKSASELAVVNIAVTDVNDNFPTFLHSPYRAHVMENFISPPLGYVITVEAFDADSPPLNSQVRYFLKDGDLDLFRINATTGDLFLQHPLDREKQSLHVLEVVAMDSGNPPLTGSGIIEVYVEDVNDHSPKFVRTEYVAFVAENSAVNTEVIQINATDDDVGLNSKLRYNLLGDKVDHFQVNIDTGLISTKVQLDREEISKYRLTLMAQDSSIVEPKATTVQLTINVLDENDNAPYFSSSSYSVSIPDRIQPGQFVFGANAVDLDSGENGLLTYSLEGEHADKFTIDTRSGVIKVARELRIEDYQQQQQADKTGSDKGVFRLHIQVSDGGAIPLTSSVELSVRLAPAHLFPFVVAPKETAFISLPEDIKPGTTLTKLKASSSKPGSSGMIKFAIAGGNIGNAFVVDANTGQVAVSEFGLDYEKTTSYEIWVEAVDSDVTAPLRSATQLTVNVTDVNDNAPLVDAVYSAQVMEEEYPPRFVTKIEATDADSGSNGIVRYRLVTDEDVLFDIDEETGEIYTSARLDREDVALHKFAVECYDLGSPSLTARTTVLVTVLDKNDNPPKFSRLFSVNVTENAEPGTFVIRVTSTDLDVGENANATYSFSENPGNKFAVDPYSGNVTVIGPLDRETEDEYALKVVALDGSWRAETPLTITVQDQNDNAPEFENAYYEFYLPEIRQQTAFVGHVTADDRDKQGPNSQITYTFKQPSDLFSIDPASGDIFTKKQLRYKSGSLASPENLYSLVAVATDNGKPPLSSECSVLINVIDANNHQPTFTRKEYFSTVPDDSFIGQRIVQIKANNDLDSGINAEIDYLKIESNDSDLFSVSKSSGWVSVSRTVKNEKHLTTFVLYVEARDHGIPPKYDRCKVVLVICGENKHRPVFSALSYRVIVPENEPVGTTILTVSASDQDDGPNGIVRYAMIDNSDDGHLLRIHPETGNIVIVQSLDYDTMKEYRLNVTATDLAFEPKTTMAALTVVLTDINDNAPVFNQTQYRVSLPENRPPNTFVTRIEATDADSPKYSIIHYSIVGGDGKDSFRIDLKTGAIYSTVRFDFEEKTSYTLDILATNPDSPMYGSATVLIGINGENEYYPRFVQPVFHMDASESATIGTSIGMVQATDQDAGEDGKVYYLLIGSSNDKGFAVNSETGVITVSKRLDRETQNRVILSVLAKNAGSIRGNDTDEAQVVISVQDGNDPPEFLEELYEADISEDAPIGSKVITVQAFDKDVKPQHNQFVYSIINGNYGEPFKIDSQTGDIETVSRLDRETVSGYNLIIAAIDTGTPPETGTVAVKIIVTDVNDNGPIFDQSSLVGYVMENEPPNTSVMTLTATDPDLPPNGAPFTYSLVGGPHRNFLNVESVSGLVRLTRSVDRESNPKLEIVVSVEDSGEPRMKSTQTITIIVLDQNDSPSSPRSVHVLVYSFNEIYPVGKIADVRPNDPDLVGDYKCKLVSEPMPKGILSIANACNLHASRTALGNTFVFSVSGNDGKHPDVLSMVTVEFSSFDNDTIENSVVIKADNVSADKFLANYKSFTDILKNAFSSSADSAFLYNVHPLSEDSLEFKLAVRISANRHYRSKEYVKQHLNKYVPNLKQLFQSSSISVGYSPCHGSGSNGTVANPCEHNGLCSEQMVISEDVEIVDSPTLVFTSPMVRHDFSCFCQDGFAGKRCEKRQDPCSPNPCSAGGTCRRQGSDFQCHCLPSRQGAHCEEERSDKCDENPCQNGGSCRESPDGLSFFCLCRPGYRGSQCELITDSCRPNPCLNGGFCVSLKPGYKCNCPEGLHGRHCEKTAFGFGELSYMTFPSLDSDTNDISITFATTKRNALLAYNYGPQTGGRSDFVALQIVDGRVAFSYGGARTAITSIIVPSSPTSESVANGRWHKVTATRNGRVLSLSVVPCLENGDSCQDCRPGDISCYADDTGPAGLLNFNNNPLYVGGLASSEQILERPGQIYSDDFVGCIHGVQINGRHLNLSKPIKSYAIEPACNRSSQNYHCSTDPDNADYAATVCGTGATGCYDQWKRTACVCGDSEYTAPNCDSALEPITLCDGSFVEFNISEKHRRINLLEFIYQGTTTWNRRRIHNIITDKSNSISNGEIKFQLKKYATLMFRTIHSNGLLFYASTNKDFTSVEMVNGQILYRSRVGKSQPVNMSADTNVILSDGQWHNLTLHTQYRTLRVYVDNEKVGEELDSESVHNFMDPYLTYLSIGGVNKDMVASAEFSTHSFSGCLANFSINGEIQSLNGAKDNSIFAEIFHNGKVSVGCAGPSITGAVTNPDPLRIGISLVLVFFVILLFAILVSFVVFRLKKQRKDKIGASVGHTKQSAASSLNSNGIMTGDVIRTTGLHSDNSVPPYMTDNGDLIRGVTGHRLVSPELISKRFKDHDMNSTVEQLQRSQRPDIIEREVVGKSPLPREEHHPPPVPSSHHSHDNNQSIAESEIPEHYDLENSSSIAPSDIDIIYHYKSYRDGGNMRKYKAIPPHMPPPGTSIYHKHNIHPRHSPHHAVGYNVHSRDSPHSVVRPPPVSRVDSPKQLNLQHQSTPLARLSPSSEMSQQMPRILTLQDISGKPLQSALLATTSSSGGVGKDVLHTNSERSLNSPVMSQLSGQSSSESRKTAGPPSQDNSAVSNSGIGIGLMGDDISRLNTHPPRNSSLVSTLDVVSCSSSRADNSSSKVHHHLHHGHNADNGDDNRSSTSTDESGNDSFTCSEIEYDNNSVSGEKLTHVILNNLSGTDTDKKPSRDKEKKNANAYSRNFDSSFRSSLSTLVASDEDISHMPPVYRNQNGSPPSIPTSLGWEYLLNWGPNFDLTGVLPELPPETINNRIPPPGILRSPNNTNANNNCAVKSNCSKSSEEYV